MRKIGCKVTVFFDAPFWVAVFEQTENANMEVCKVTFGAEPKDNEVYGYLLRNWNELRFSPPIKADRKQDVTIKPKRMLRAIQKQLAAPGVGTKAQQALKLQQEEAKAARKQKSRARKEEEKLRRLALRQQKRKEKHRGK